MVVFLEVNEAMDFLNEQKKVVELKPTRKVYYEKYETKTKISKQGITYHSFNEPCEVYYNGVELKYWDKYGNSKKFSEKELNEAVFVLEDENDFKRRLEFSEDIEKILEL